MKALSHYVGIVVNDLYTFIGFIKTSHQFFHRKYSNLYFNTNGSFMPNFEGNQKRFG